MSLARPKRITPQKALATLFIGLICISNKVYSEQQSFPLEATYWRLVAMDGQAITMPNDEALPHIALHAETNRIAGFGGCNRFFALYTHGDANALSVTPMGGGRAICEGASAIEQDFIGALAGVKFYVLNGESLELHDAEITRLKFVAVAK